MCRHKRVRHIDINTVDDPEGQTFWRGRLHLWVKTFLISTVTGMAIVDAVDERMSNHESEVPHKIPTAAEAQNTLHLICNEIECNGSNDSVMMCLWELRRVGQGYAINMADDIFPTKKRGPTPSHRMNKLWSMHVVPDKEAHATCYQLFVHMWIFCALMLWLGIDQCEAERHAMNLFLAKANKHKRAFMHLHAYMATARRAMW